MIFWREIVYIVFELNLYDKYGAFEVDSSTVWVQESSSFNIPVPKQFNDREKFGYALKRAIYDDYRWINRSLVWTFWLLEMIEFFTTRTFKLVEIDQSVSETSDTLPIVQLSVPIIFALIYKLTKSSDKPKVTN